MSSTIYSVLKREMRRIWQFKAYLATLTILPLCASLFFAVIFTKGTPHELPIVVADMSNSQLSRRVISMIDATPEISIAFECDNIPKCEQMVRSGRVGAMVIIPSHFERDILGLNTTNIEAYISGTNILQNGLITKGLQMAIETFSIGIQIQALTQQGLTQKQALAQTVPIRIDEHILFNPYTNYSYYLSPSFISMMLLIFTMLATIFAIGSELRYSTAGDWLTTANDSTYKALAGKLLPTFATMTIHAIIMFIILFEFIGVPLRGNLWVLFAGCEVFILSYIAVAVFIISITADMRLAMSLGGGYSVMAFSLSGLTFPTMAMHEGIQWLGHIFPFTYFTEIIIDQALRGAPIGNSLLQISYLMIFLLLPLSTLTRLYKITNDRRYWGRA